MRTGSTNDKNEKTVPDKCKARGCTGKAILSEHIMKTCKPYADYHRLLEQEKHGE